MILVLIIVSTACQGRATIVAPTTIARLSPVTITFACRDYEREHFDLLAAEFNEAQPAYQVQLLSADDLVGDRWDDAIHILANGAATFTGWAPSTQDINQGLVRDLAPLSAADPGFAATRDDFYPAALAGFQRDAALWGLPGYLDPLLVFYDRATLSKAGLTEPSSNWTMADFEAAAQKLTTPGAPQQYGLALPAYDAAASLVLRHSSSWQTNTTQQGAQLLAQPAILDSANWLIKLAREQRVMPDLSQLAGEHPVTDLVTGGQVAMWITRLSHQQALMRLYNMDAQRIGAAPLPAGPASPLEVNAYGYVMSAGSQQPEAAWAWLNYLAGHAGPSAWEGLPARRSLAQVSATWQQLDATWRAGYERMAGQNATMVSEEAATALSELLNKSLTEKSDPAMLLTSAQANVGAQPQSTAAGAPPMVPTATQPTAAATAAATHTVRFCAVAYPPKLYEDLGRKFSETHPEVRLKISGGGSFSYEGQSLKLGNCDCFAYFVHGQFQDAKLREAVVNLQPFVDTDKTLPADYVPSVLDAMRWENSLYAIPAYSNVRVLFYNKDLFDKAGMPYPQAGWTIEGFREAALRLSAGEGAQRVYGYVPLDLGLSDFGYFVAQKGGFAPFTGAEYAQAPAALDADRITDAVRWYTGLAVTDKVMPPFQIIKGEYSDYQKLHAERLKLIQTGRAAMWTDALASSRTPAPTLRFGVAPLPSDSDALLVSHPVGYMISSASEEREACWNWITFLTHEPLAVRSAPVRQAFLADSSQLQPQFGSFSPTDKAVATAELLATYSASLPRAEPYPGRENGYLYEAFDAIMDGAPVDRAVQAALAKDTAFQQCLAEASRQTVSERVQSCLSRVATGK